jgi:hypothetical protein
MTIYILSILISFPIILANVSRENYHLYDLGVSIGEILQVILVSCIPGLNIIITLCALGELVTASDITYFKWK